MRTVSYVDVHLFILRLLLEMSSDEEYEHNYDIEEDCQETFHTTREGN